MPKEALKHIPNCLSFFRLFLSPFFIFYLKSGNVRFAAVALVLAGLSDFFDGYFARKFGCVSRFGELLDPLADKVFLNTVFWGIYCFSLHSLPIFVLAILLTVRDILLICGVLFSIFFRIKRETRPIFLSKLCTAFMFLLCVISIFCPRTCIQIVLSYICVILIIITSGIYVKRFIND